MQMLEAKNAKSSRYGLILILTIVMIDITGFAMILPVVPNYLQQLTGKDIAAASLDGGVLLMIYAVMQFLFAPMIGNLSDRFGRRPILLLAIISFALDNLIWAFAGSYAILFIGRILSGISGSSYYNSSAYIADISDEKTCTRNYGLLGTVFGVGFVIGPILGGWLGELGPRVPFYFVAGLSFLNFIIAWFLLPETLSKQSRRAFSFKRSNPLGALMHLRKYPTVFWIALVFFFYWMEQAVWFAVWAYVAIDRYEWSEFAIGLCYGIFGIGQAVIMGLLLPYLVKKWTDWRICMVGLIFALLAIGGYSLASQGWMIYVVFAFTCFEYLVYAPMRTLAVAQVPDNAQGELQGALNSITSITAMIGPIFYTQIFYEFTREGAPIHFAGAPFAAAFFILLIAVIIFIVKVKPTRKLESAGQQ